MRIALKLIGIIGLFFSMILLLPLRPIGWKRQTLLQMHLRGLCRILGLRIRFEGPHPSRSPKVFLSNHISYVDVFVIGSLFPTGFVAKQELLSWPFIGRLGRVANTIFVDRMSVLSRLRTLFAVKKNVSHSSYCIFPEGTTTAELTPQIQIWHRGHAALINETIEGFYCLGLKYADQRDIAWIGDDALIPHLFRLLKRKHIDVYVAGAYLKSNDWPFEDIAKESCALVSHLAIKAQEFERPRAKRSHSPLPITTHEFSSIPGRLLSHSRPAG